MFIDIDGQRVPFFIESSDLVSKDQAILKLEFIDSVEEAKKMSGREVYLDQEHKPASVGPVDDLSLVVGYQVRDQRLGVIGQITGYLPNEMNPVWLIDVNGKEIMVPATVEFILKSDHKKQSILLDLPLGITEL